MKSITRNQLDSYYLNLFSFFKGEDYCPNGLQIQGSNSISKIAFCVSATKDSITKAVDLGVDAIVAHHGIIWKFNSNKTITTAYYNRIAPLIKNDISLYGYHLPLDAHPEVGNNIEICKKLELINISKFGTINNIDIGFKGEFKSPINNMLLKKKFESIFDKEIILSTNNCSTEIKNIGIISGGANNEWTHSLEHNLDAYCSGEISEHNWHESKENNISFYACGHHATERLGPIALMNKTKKDLGVECIFIDSDNPV